MPSNVENVLDSFGNGLTVATDEHELTDPPIYVEVEPDLSGVPTTVTFGVFSWTLLGVASSGTFLNGEPWVVPSGASVILTAINPVPYVSTGPDPRHAHGSMEDPQVFRNSPGSNFPGSVQGYDNAMYGANAARGVGGANLDYNEQLNIGLQLPYTITPDSSIVSTQSVGAAGARPQLKEAAVLTVLASAPAAGSFRPAYVEQYDGNKTIYSNSGIDYSALQVLTSVGGMPSWDEAAGWFAKCRLNHTPQWLQRYQHPSKNMPDYGQDIACQVSTAALMLLDDAASDATKKPLLENFLQLGIDLYHVAKAVEKGAKEGGATNAQARLKYGLNPFYSNGGHGNGNKWPILFAGMVLGVQDMIDITQPTSAVEFSEDDSTFWLDDVTPADPEWSDRYLTEPERYTNLRVPGQWVADDEDTISPPFTSDENTANQSLKYRRCCTTNAMYGVALAAAAFPSAKTNWENDAFFAYQTRYRDTELPISGLGAGSLTRWPVYGGKWAYHMFETHKATYGLDTYPSS